MRQANITKLITDHSCAMSNFLCVRVCWKLIQNRSIFKQPTLNCTNAHAYTQNSILSMPPYATTFMTTASYFAKNVYIGDGTLKRVGTSSLLMRETHTFCGMGVNCVWSTWDLRTAKRVKMLVDQWAKHCLFSFWTLIQLRDAPMRKDTRLFQPSL